MKYSSDIKKSPSQQLISINNCGELRVEADSHVRRYAGRSDYQLIYVCQGQCVVTLEGAVYVAHPGDCVLYRPGEVQDYLLAKNVRPHTYWVHFNGEVCRALFETLELQEVHIVRVEENREIQHLLSRICQYHHLEIPHRELICSGLMQTILALVSNEAHRQGLPAAKGRDKITELISRIKLTPNLDMTVEQCAAFCHLSKVHFTRVFRQTTGMPPVRFMLHIRVNRAKELLDFTDKPVAEIAEACGFADQNYFARVFKQLTGMSPTQYRRAEKPE